ncbi:unnamed protein product [Periconia digitata]|uniref:F-box domain-containing protein n=1 Tax=Periconia digitata TaxID=1303443 RepID=A0A9W4XLW2_9PLEO|nr:unnamed protein product [Periconia digitata]
MGLLDIPVEILDEILDLSLPLGIEGLALSCKAIYQRAAPQIRQHNALRRTWRCTNNSRTRRTDDTLQILYDIFQEPLGADYIEVLDLCDERIPNDGHYLTDRQWGAVEEPQSRSIEPNSRSSINFREIPMAMGNLKTFIEKSFQATAKQVNMDDVWSDIMKTELHPDEDDYKESIWTVVSLLNMLPNITTLRLPSWWEGPQGAVGETLHSIAQAANITGGPPKSLSKLKTILPFAEIGYESKAALQSVYECLTLGTMRELYLVSAVAVDDQYTGQPFKWIHPELTSSITRIEFAASCIDADGLSQLVAHTPHLAIFKYSHQCKWHGCQYDWNAGTFVETLAHHCGNTIIEIALTLEGLHGHIINGTSSFRSFPKLEKLEVDIELFCGPPVESGQRQGQDAYIPPGDNPWAKADIPCIGSMLPDNMREVQINTDYETPDHDALRALLKNLREQRAERLHHLERVIVREYNGKSVQDLVDQAGATLETLGAGSMGPYLKENVPEWRRKFNDRMVRMLQGNLSTD